MLGQIQILVLLAVSLFSCSLVKCECQVTSQSYSTTDGLVIAQVAHVITFTAKCGQKEDPTLFADVNGKTLPVIRSLDGKTYQISWTVELAKSSSQHISIPVYDEERYSQLRKAQRAGEQSTVKPLFELALNHYGTYRGPWIQTELVAGIAAVVLWWVAYTHKAKLTS